MFYIIEIIESGIFMQANGANDARPLTAIFDDTVSLFAIMVTLVTALAIIVAHGAIRCMFTDITLLTHQMITRIKLYYSTDIL